MIDQKGVDQSLSESECIIGSLSTLSSTESTWLAFTSAQLPAFRVMQEMVMYKRNSMQVQPIHMSLSFPSINIFAIFGHFVHRFPSAIRLRHQLTRSSSAPFSEQHPIIWLKKWLMHVDAGYYPSWSHKNCIVVSCLVQLLTSWTSTWTTIPVLFSVKASDQLAHDPRVVRISIISCWRNKYAHYLYVFR